MDYMWGLFSLEEVVDELELEPTLGTEMLDPWFLAYWGSRKIVFVAEDGFQATDSQTLYASLKFGMHLLIKSIPNGAHNFAFSSSSKLSVL
jgi:hypothetical protein